MRIQELEQSLGVKLFDRSGRAVRLTPKGKEMVPYVQQLIDLAAEMQQRITSSELLSGFIRLGVVEAVSTTWLPRFIRIFQERYPHVTLELEVALSLELTEKLRNGMLDVIFSLGQPPGPNYGAESLGSLQIEWMASSSLDIKENDIRATLFERWPFITLNRNSYHSANIRAWMTKNKIRCGRVVVCNSMSGVVILVNAGLGFALLPTVCYRQDIEAGKLRTFGTPEGMQPVEVFAVYSMDEYRPIARLVTEVAVEVSDFTHAVE